MIIVLDGHERTMRDDIETIEIVIELCVYEYEYCMVHSMLTLHLSSQS